MSQAVEAGQIWVHPTLPHRWKVEFVNPEGEVFALCGYPRGDNTYRWDHAATNLGYVPFAYGQWVVEGKLKTYSKINQKTLRKRIRDQIAQSVLNGK